MHDEVLSCQRVPVTRLDIISYHNGDSRCQDPDCPCHEAMKQFLVERTPVTRIPVTQSHLACVIGGNRVCRDPDCPCHQAEKHYGDIFYDSVVELVWQIAYKFHTACYPYEVKDLCSICLARIFKKIHQYDPKWAVSTWVWHVSTNALNSETEPMRNAAGIMVPMVDGMDAPLVESDPFLASEIRLAAHELLESYPEWEDVLLTIFSGMDNPNQFLPDRLCVSKIAEATNRKYNDVYMFVKKVIRPFFINRFQTEGEEQ